MELQTLPNKFSNSADFSTFGSIEWRGHGGGKPTMQSVDFDQQLDKIAIWLEQWDHDQV